MSNTAIRIDGLWKEFVIGGRQRSGMTFRETVADLFMSPFRRLAGSQDGGTAETRFWALRDVSLEIARGEVVGIIGRNGAGKSTLLKVLSRITAPTRGEITINGRVASLLEVGTGFHPELTGRENVFLNGAILGMSRAEIRAKFDEIVDFSGVETFIDTPVKRYSSGMQVRLAFAVAAHLEPEILIIDEVLAVGDAEFQCKCLGKMQDVAGHGRTVLFVSHNLAAVRSLCSRGVLIESGAIVIDGKVDAALECYGRSGQSSAASIRERTDRRGNGAARLTAIRTVWLMSPYPQQSFELDVAFRQRLRTFRIVLAIYNAKSDCVVRLESRERLRLSPSATHATFRVVLPTDVGLAVGSYSVNVLVDDGVDWCDHVEHALGFEVRGDHLSHLTREPRADETVCIAAQWSVSASGEVPSPATRNDG